MRTRIKPLMCELSFLRTIMLQEDYFCHIVTSWSRLRFGLLQNLTEVELTTITVRVNIEIINLACYENLLSGVDYYCPKFCDTALVVT